jgi:hypothetical protein
MLGVHAMISFFHLHGVALRKAGIIEPGAVVVESVGLDHKGVKDARYMWLSRGKLRQSRLARKFF